MPRTPNSIPHPRPQAPEIRSHSYFKPHPERGLYPGLHFPACPGLRFSPPSPACSRRRTTSPSIPGDSRLSPGKGPCSCCKFPKIFWLSRWMRRVTTWGTGGQRSNETRGATVLVLLFPPPTGVPGSPLLGPHDEEPCPNSRVSASSPLPGALSALNLSY